MCQVGRQKYFAQTLIKLDTEFQLKQRLWKDHVVYRLIEGTAELQSGERAGKRKFIQWLIEQFAKNEAAQRCRK